MSCRSIARSVAGARTASPRAHVRRAECARVRDAFLWKQACARALPRSRSGWLTCVWVWGGANLVLSPWKGSSGEGPTPPDLEHDGAILQVRATDDLGRTVGCPCFLRVEGAGRAKQREFDAAPAADNRDFESEADRFPGYRPVVHDVALSESFGRVPATSHQDGQSHRVQQLIRELEAGEIEERERIRVRAGIHAT